MLKKRIVIHTMVVVKTDDPKEAQQLYEEVSLTNDNLTLLHDKIQLENVEIKDDQPEIGWQKVDAPEGAPDN